MIKINEGFFTIKSTVKYINRGELYNKDSFIGLLLNRFNFHVGIKENVSNCKAKNYLEFRIFLLNNASGIH